MPRGRPRKNKTTSSIPVTEESKGVGKKNWSDTLFLIVETPKKSKPQLHSYTEIEAAANSMVKLMKDIRPSSKFEVVKKPVDWNGPVSIV